MQLEFAKMHGLGNDFMIVHWPDEIGEPSPERVRALADRRRGVGFDQLLLVGALSAGRDRASYRVFNADGGEVEQCGNGVRCVASFLASAPGEKLSLTSLGGTIEAELLEDGFVTVSFGEPDFRPSSLPFEAPRRSDRYRLTLDAGEAVFGAVSIGNPHIVIEVDSVDEAPVGILGSELAAHRNFSQGVNVGFMQCDDREHVRLRVFERGVGETRACGTGAAAAVAVGRSWGRLAEDVAVRLPGGTLRVSWPGPGAPLWQTGPATKVYEGRIEL
ncbi:diaminopimelate epimerase [Candidatus Rariloculus sp.]|uniref:diaminopimelate epimerase n=1 Tax=Candidatus Rariloculus sp. TaxID=3101265 RepID=UPI003D0AF0C0